MKEWTRIGALVFACAVLLALPGGASANIFLELDGIQGESTTVGFENQIELSSLQLGLGKNAAAKGPSFSEVAVTKLVDKSSSALMLRTATGATIPTAKVRFTTQGDARIDVYLRYCFTGVRITSFSQSSGGERPSESLSFTYATIVQSYTQGSGAGSGTVFAAGWDLLRNIQLNTTCND